MLFSGIKVRWQTPWMWISVGSSQNGGLGYHAVLQMAVISAHPFSYSLLATVLFFFFSSVVGGLFIKNWPCVAEKKESPDSVV